MEQTASSATIFPSTVTLGKGTSQSFAGNVLDQFNHELIVPSAFTWSVTGGETIAADGTFSAANVGGPYTVTGTSGALSGTASVTVTGQTLTDWRAIHFTAAERSAGLDANSLDPDGDGLSNFSEYCLGSDPRATTSGFVPAFDATRHLTLTFTRPKGLPGVSYFAEVSDDFTTWTLLSSPEVLDEGDPQLIRFRDPIGSESSPQRFMRVRLNAPVP